VAFVLLLLLQDAPSPLRVDGARLVDKDGKELLLRGVSFPDPHPIGKEWKREHFELLAKGWKANCVRIPVHPGWWKKHGAAAYDKLLDDALGWCRELGLYAIVDYHAIGNPKTGKAQKDAPEYDSTMETARAFWKHAAGRHKDKPWVLFEIFNEPMGIAWKDLRPIATELVGVIRAEAPEAVVIVSSPDWTYDLRGPAAEPVDAKNLMYAWHVYPVRGRGWEPYLAEARKKFPVIATEWGFDLQGDSVTLGNTEGFGLPLLRMMEETRMHWTAWVYHPQWGPPLLSNWNGGLSPFGRLARGWLNGERPPDRPAPKVVNDLTIWLRSVDLARLGDSAFDLVAIDPAAWTRNEIENLKWSAGGPKRVLAHLPIAETAEGRPTWNKDWSAKRPDWMTPAGRVKYWEEGWGKALLDAVDRLVATGYDGLLLDGVDLWDAWRKQEKDERCGPRMADLVDRAGAQGRKKDKAFLVFTLGGESLIETPRFLPAIDGLVRPGTYFTGDRPNRPTDVLESQAKLDKAVAAGKRVVVLEQPGAKDRLDWLWERAKAKGYTPCVAPKDFDALLIPEGHSPD
jgi:uncharacterized protein (TIGR01370 family)